MHHFEGDLDKEIPCMNNLNGRFAQTSFSKLDGTEKINASSKRSTINHANILGLEGTVFFPVDSQ